jgi:CHAT domain-containing protein
MSLWKVPDEPTAQLMEAFYENLGAGMGRAEALREAQLALGRLYPPPWFWGAFICQGDPGPLETPARTTEDGPS